MSEKVRTIGVFLFLGVFLFFPMPFIAAGTMFTALLEGNIGGAALYLVLLGLSVLINIWWYKRFRREYRRYALIDNQQKGRTGAGIGR
jgi:membrane protease YdiL (CAAX protease family)